MPVLKENRLVKRLATGGGWLLRKTPAQNPRVNIRRVQTLKSSVHGFLPGSLQPLFRRRGCCGGWRSLSANGHQTDAGQLDQAAVAIDRQWLTKRMDPACVVVRREAKRGDAKTHGGAGGQRASFRHGAGTVSPARCTTLCFHGRILLLSSDSRGPFLTSNRRSRVKRRALRPYLPSAASGRYDC